MSSLAEHLHLVEPSASYLSSTSGSTVVKRLIWFSLSSDTRKSYHTAVSSYEEFCMLQGVRAWPATSHMLEEWVANRIYGGILPRQTQIKPNTVVAYLSGLRSYQIDHRFPLDVFEESYLARVIRGRRLFPQVKAQRFPITKDILQRIASRLPTSIEDHNIDTAFKILWAGFLRLGEITSTSAEQSRSTFTDTGVTRSDISFAEIDQYAILRLKRSKNDTEQTGVQIIF